MKTRKVNLRKELEHYTDITCPDYLYDAYRSIVYGERLPNRAEILRQAEQDIVEDENRRVQEIFNRDRRQMPRLESAKWNWNTK